MPDGHHDAEAGAVGAGDVLEDSFVDAVAELAAVAAAGAAAAGAGAVAAGAGAVDAGAAAAVADDQVVAYSSLHAHHDGTAE